MAFKHWFKALPALGNFLFFKRRTPLFAAWNLTFDCNLSCLYCGTSDLKGPELDTPGVLAGLNELWDLGSRWITFGGGEPLLRGDIDRILGHAKRLGFQVFLSTNGTLAREKAGALKSVDHVNLSLDGGREIHDLIRGKGTFDKAMEAIHVCRETGVPVSLLCVLSRLNLEHIREVLAIAALNHLTVMFQPATARLNSSSRANPVAPPVEAYRKAVNSLIALKKNGAPVRNSLTGLRHLAQWPEPASLRCPAGTMIAVVEADGSILACHMDQDLPRRPGPGGLTARFNDLVPPGDCGQCWCAPVVELGLILSLRPEAVFNALRLLPAPSRSGPLKKDKSGPDGGDI